jgi:hypothetical protein
LEHEADSPPRAFVFQDLELLGLLGQGPAMLADRLLVAGDLTSERRSPGLRLHRT